MSNMTRAEAMNKIEKCMINNIPGSDREELYNFQIHGFSNDTVFEMLEEVRNNNAELDPNNEFESVQSILVFSPCQGRIKDAANRYLSDYTEAEFVEECGCLDKINEYFSGADLKEDEIRAAFRKD